MVQKVTESNFVIPISTNKDAIEKLALKEKRPHYASVKYETVELEKRYYH